MGSDVFYRMYGFGWEWPDVPGSGGGNAVRNCQTQAELNHKNSAPITWT